MFDPQLLVAICFVATLAMNTLHWVASGGRNFFTKARVTWNVLSVVWNAVILVVSILILLGVNAGVVFGVHFAMVILAGEAIWLAASIWSRSRANRSAAQASS